MTKVIDCGKFNPESGCDHVIRAETEAEALRMAAEHAQEHGIQPTPALFEKVKQHMVDA